MQSIRTLSMVEIKASLADPAGEAVYQRISDEALKLRQLGWTFDQIARRFGVNKTTAASAVRWAKTDHNLGRLSVRYKELSARAQELNRAGRSINAIAKELGVSWQVAKSAVLGRWLRSPPPLPHGQLALLDKD